MAGPGHRGRTTKLTPETAAKITDAIRAGVWIRQAAEHAGISESSLYYWLERGKNPDEPDPRYSEFLEAVTRARAESEATAVAVLRRHMPDDWRAAAFYLERSFPERWRRREAIEHTGANGGPVQTNVNLRALNAEQLEQLEQLLRAADTR